MMASPSHARPPTRDLWLVALAVVVLAALAVRLYGLDWDDGTDLHPDELFIAKIVLIDRIRFDWPPDLARLVDPARSGLNPRSADPATGQFREFAYGALPLWITDAVGWALSQVTGVNWNYAERAYLVGRALSAVLSALTILPIAALGAAVGGRSVGLLAALFAALAPMSIQLAHFFTTDSWLTFFVALCLLACVKAVQTQGRGVWFAAAGAAFGLAMASKGSVFALAVPVATAIAVVALGRLGRGSLSLALRSAVVNASLAGVAALASFFAFEPFALLRPDVYLQSLRTQADIASGLFDVPFTRVYSGTLPVLYQLEQFVRWGYGPVAGLLALVGIAMLASLAVRRGSAPALILTSWVVAYGAVMAVSEVKFLRYLEPLAPVCAVGAALAVAWLAARLRSLAPRPVAGLATSLILILTAAWTAAFVSIYAHENPRLAATKWIYATVPPGSMLTAEYWDDALPRGLGFGFSAQTSGLGTVMLDLYRDLPPSEASDAIYDGISDADYVVQSSQRVESAIEAAPWRYPVQGRFFDQLEKGTLGFTQAAGFAQSLALGSISIDDGKADESFINYDHPRVAIYERAAPPSRENYDAAMEWSLQRPWFPAREPPQPTLLLDGPVGENPSVADARWSEALTGSTGGAFVVWIVLLVALLGVGLPIARFALGGFPDQGWGLARTLGLVVAAYPVWLGASLELFRFRAIWVLVALLLIALLGWRLLNRNGSSADATPRAAASMVWLHAETVFWLVFALFLAFRLLNPDGWHPIWGGEKAMEFAQINAIGRSAFFPPYDPWYADGYVNYYYYGFYLVAFLLKATGIPSEVGFNLALPTFMAMLASGGFSVAAALARGLTRSPRLTVVGGWMGAIALSILGNLSAIRAVSEAAGARFDPFIHWTWSGSRAIDDVITEFPFFSGLYADLHAHVIALPLTVAVIALGFALASGASERETERQGQQFVNVTFVARAALVALLLGSLSATNAWDVPVYVALTVAALLMATTWQGLGWRPAFRFIAASLLTVGGAWLLFLPFHRHFVALFSAVALVRDPTDLLQFLGHLGGLVVICALGITVLLSLPIRSLAMPWPLVALVMGVLGLALLADIRGPAEARAGDVLLIIAIAAPPVAAAWPRLSGAQAAPRRQTWFQRGILILALAVAVVAIAIEREVFALLLLLGCAAAVGWLRLERVGDRFVCLLIAAGTLTAAGAEIVVVADDLIGSPAYRMNTVFKFYNQVWVLLGLAAAGLVALMLRETLRGARIGQDRAQGIPGAVAWSRLGVGISAIVLVVAMAYPALATGPRLAQQFTPGTRPGTLNALGWMAEGTVPSFGPDGRVEIAFAGDAAAIGWFNEHVKGTPVIAEASIGPYRCNGSRISNATGLPTIIGWERHQQQQRYPETLPARVEDVRELYTSADPQVKESILRRYNVAYVVVGDLERRYPRADNECTPTGSAAGISAFAEMIGPTLETAFAANGTTIYKVLPLSAA